MHTKIARHRNNFIILQNFDLTRSSKSRYRLNHINIIHAIENTIYINVCAYSVKDISLVDFSHFGLYSLLPNTVEPTPLSCSIHLAESLIIQLLMSLKWRRVSIWVLEHTCTLRRRIHNHLQSLLIQKMSKIYWHLSKLLLIWISKCFMLSDLKIHTPNGCKEGKNSLMFHHSTTIVWVSWREISAQDSYINLHCEQQHSAPYVFIGVCFVYRLPSGMLHGYDHDISLQL